MRSEHNLGAYALSMLMVVFVVVVVLSRTIAVNDM